MRTFISTILLLLTVATITIAQDVPGEVEAPDADGTNNGTVVAAPVPAPVLLKFPQQCLYDVARKRVNDDCPVAELPPKCERGTLVQTQNGEKFEMCCCDFSNFAVPPPPQ